MKLIVFIAACLLMVGCVPNVRPDSYSVGSVGQVNRTVAGKVISVREIHIDGTQGGGALAGGSIGAVAGSSVGGGDRANAVGALGGAVVGAIVGAAMERGVSAQMGVEYVVQTENGNLMTVVQGTEPVLPAGQAVLVLYGSPARIIADPRSAP